MRQLTQKPTVSYCLDEWEKRPWHFRNHVRALPDGRRVAVWVGRWAEPPYDRTRALGTRLNNIINKHHTRQPFLEHPHFKRVFQARDCLSGSQLKGGDPHTESCNPEGWLGIGFLPADFADSRSVWPRWRHLDHVRPQHTDDWVSATEMERARLVGLWEELVQQPDEALLALLGEV